jgi:hypothetical protein
VWIKSRSNTLFHFLIDTVRGNNLELYSNATNSESSNSTTLTAFNSDGFDLGDRFGTNQNTGSYVAWTWDAGSSTDTNNTDGSIIPTGVRANASAGFSIVSYTGTGSAASVGHGLGTAPQMIIVKSRSNATDWCVYHADVGNTEFLKLNSTNASQSFNAWNSTSPTSTVFSIGNIGETNTNDYTYVAYCFAPVAGYSAIGSYTGNGSADGPFVSLSFRPAFLMIKNISQANSWFIIDTKVNTYNVVGDYLLAEQSAAESSFDWLDILSNGFKLRSTATGNNNSGIQNLYIAFAENPFQANGGLAR